MGVVEMKVAVWHNTSNSEELVATDARVCYSAQPIREIQKSVHGDEGWVDKLIGMGHESPLEHAVFTFVVEGVSRSLLAQLTRHRIASFSVRSQRYVGETKKDGQNGTFGYVMPPSIEALGSAAQVEFARQMNQSQQWYNGWVEALGGGRGTYEDARFILPNVAATSLVMTMNARELRHFFRVRLCQRAQWEIRALADEMLRLTKGRAPHLFAGAGPACVSEPCPEGKMGCGKMTEMRERYRD